MTEPYLEKDYDDAERADIAAETENLDLLREDRASCWQELNEHDDRGEQVGIAVVQRELDKDRPRADIEPVSLGKLVEFGLSHVSIAVEVECVTTALNSDRCVIFRPVYNPRQYFN